MVGMKEFPDKYFDLAIVDPPYGIGRHKACGQRNNGFQAFIHDVKEWDKVRPNEKYFGELKRISVNYIIWGANYFIDYLTMDLTWIVWNKVQPEGVSFAMHELAVCSIKSQPKVYTQSIASNNNRATNRTDAKQYERIHPTQKPVKLYKWLLKNYAKPGDKILDTHLGSGSSRIAAADMGFDFTGYEIDKDYFEAQEKRFRQFTSQTKLFPQNVA